MSCFKSFMQWFAAFLCALVLVNALCFVYERPAYFIKTEDGASPVIRHPGVLNVHGTEGYSMGRVDKNGYLNPDRELAEDYILIMGASHTLGKELPENERFSAIVSDELSQGDGRLHAYNIAHDGNFLPSILGHFPNAVQIHPDSAAVIIEIGNTDFTSEEITERLMNIPDCNFQTAQERFETMSRTRKLKCLIKESFPFYELMQIKARTQKNEKAGTEEFTVQDREYMDAVRTGLAVMRESYPGTIAFVYHPQMQIREDGTVQWIYSRTWPLFQEVCREYGVDIIDLGSAFDENYRKNHSVPYGFANTTPGNGHMNGVGHQIAANEIIRYLEEAAK